MARKKVGSWLERLEKRLLAVLGPAQLSPVGKPAPPSGDRTGGVDGAYVVRRDASGNTYLEAAPRPADPPKGQ